MKKMRRLAGAIFCTCFMVSLCACSNSASIPKAAEADSTQPYPVTVRGISFSQKPEKIASVSASLTEILCALGYEGRLTGVSDYCDYPESVASLPKLGSALSPDISAIIEIQPDVVLTQTAFAKKDLEQLEQNSIKVVVLPPASNFEELSALYDDIVTIADGSTAYEKRGTHLVKTIVEKIEMYQENIAQSQIERALYLTTLQPNGAGGDTLLQGIFEHMGLQNAIKSSAKWETSFEKIAESNPQVIFCGADALPEAVLASPELAGTDAVKNGLVFSIDSLPLERQSPRLYQIAQEMADKILANEAGEPPAE